MMVIISTMAMTMAMITLATLSCILAGAVGYAMRLADEDMPSASNSRKAVLIFIAGTLQLAALSFAALIGGMV